MVKIGDKFKCYSLKLNKYLQSIGYKSIKDDYDEKVHKNYYVYIVDAKFIDILIEWKKNKEDGFKVKLIEKL